MVSGDKMGASKKGNKGCEIMAFQAETRDAKYWCIMNCQGGAFIELIVSEFLIL